MGFRLISLAAKRDDRASFLDDLRLVATGTTVDHPDECLTGAQIGDWYVIQVMNSSPFRRHIDDPLLAKLSAAVEIVACGVHENNGSSFVTMWETGCQRWSVSHEANLDGRHLAREGDVPPDFAAFANEACELDEDEEADEAIRPGLQCANRPLPAHDRFSLRCLGRRRFAVGRAAPASDEADRYMDVEGKPATHWPLAFQARAAIDAMNPNGGPGFVILQGANGDYLQTAGGDGAYLAEWREHAGGPFRHYVAGRKGVVIPGTIKIPTNGAHVLARWNEKLSAAEVKQLATAFLSCEPRPANFSWRDISDMFDRAE